MTSRPAKLFALDEEDLSVVSAHVQDAVAKAADIRWTAARKQFAIPMNRFAWEEAARRGRQPDERRRAILHFDRVLRARVLGLPERRGDEVLSILAVVFDPVDAPAGTITIACSGDVVIELDVECIEARLSDLGSAWAASMRPKHVVR